MAKNEKDTNSYIDKVSFISEWILIAEGLSDVQVRSITNSVEGELREKAKIEPIRKEGVNEAKWALLDYGDSVSYTHLTLPTNDLV